MRSPETIIPNVHTYLLIPPPSHLVCIPFVSLHLPLRCHCPHCHDFLMWVPGTSQRYHMHLLHSDPWPLRFLDWTKKEERKKKWEGRKDKGKGSEGGREGGEKEKEEGKIYVLFFFKMDSLELLRFPKKIHVLKRLRATTHISCRNIVKCFGSLRWEA